MEALEKVVYLVEVSTLEMDCSTEFFVEQTIEMIDLMAEDGMKGWKDK